MRRYLRWQFWRISLGIRIWSNTIRLWVLLKIRPLPDVARETLTPTSGTAALAIPPWRLGHAVDRATTLGRWQPRCLVRALVLCHLLSRQGVSPELVIGLPEVPSGPDAHAWVELDGVDIGPPPGSAGHVELARYTASTTT
jgi:hypothetical protein